METEIEILKRENSELKAEVAELKAKIIILGDEDDICPRCRKPQGKFLKKAPSIIFEQFGLMSKFYKCKSCGNEYEK